MRGSPDGEITPARDSREAIGRDQAEIQRLQRLQQQVQWGMEAMPADQQEQLRRFLAGQGEITAGDQLGRRARGRGTRARPSVEEGSASGEH